MQGVGEVRAKLLEKELGIVTMRDMLYHFPFRYIDRSRTYKVREVTEDNASAFIQLRVRVIGKSFAGEGRKQRFSVYCADETGRVELIWFKGIKWIEKVIEPNREYIVFGRPSFFRGGAGSELDGITLKIRCEKSHPARYQINQRQKRRKLK